MWTFFLILFSVTLHAELSDGVTCQDIDLSARFGPVHKQTSGWCWALACTDMMSDLLNLNGGNKIAPVDAALSRYTVPLDKLTRLYAKSHGLNGSEFDWARVSVEEYRESEYGISYKNKSGSITSCVQAYNLRGGMCSVNQVGVVNELSIVQKIENPTVEEIVEQSLSMDTSPLLKAIRHEPARLSRGKFENVYDARLVRSIRENCRNTPLWLNDFEGLRREMNEKALYAADDKIKQKCIPRTRIPEILTHTRKFEEGENSAAAKTLGDLILSRRPVGMTYNVGFLIGQPDQKMRHVSMVVGSRRKGNRCEFLIRNSWGPDCNQYVWPYSLPENCQQGNVWVTESDINKNAAYLVDAKLASD